MQHPDFSFFSFGLLMVRDWERIEPVDTEEVVCECSLLDEGSLAVGLFTVSTPVIDSGISGKSLAKDSKTG